MPIDPVGFGSDGKQHIPASDNLNHNRDLNFAGRVDNLGAGLSQKTAADINRESLGWLKSKYVKIAPLTDAQLDAARESFKAQKPYISKVNARNLAGKTVDSLLRSKTESNGRVYYGKASVEKRDEATFERLQRELAAGSESLAVRQLYQLMHGDLPTEIMFSERGVSACDKNIDDPRNPGGKRNLVHVNTRYSVLDPDPRSLTVSPLCVVLGHEIEHANIPARLMLWLTKQKNTSLTNGEEIRVIDGFETAMLKAMGFKARTTHTSFYVPIDKGDGRTIALPFDSAAGVGTLKRGDKLSGKIVQADERTVTVRRDDGTNVTFETKMLVGCINGLGQFRRIGFEDPSSILEKGTEYLKKTVAFIRAQERLAGEPISEELKLFVAIEESMVEDPNISKQIEAWRIAAKRHDPVTISIDKDGRINMARVSRDPNPIQTHQAKLDQERWHNVRNRLIAAIILTSSIGLVMLAVLYAIRRHERKQEKRTRMLAQAQVPILQPPQTPAPFGAYATQLPMTATTQ